MEKLGLRCKQK